MQNVTRCFRSFVIVLLSPLFAPACAGARLGATGDRQQESRGSQQEPLGPEQDPPGSSQAPSGAEGDSSNVPDVAGPSESAGEATNVNDEVDIGSDDGDADRDAVSSKAITSGPISMVEELMHNDREPAAERPRVPPRV